MRIRQSKSIKTLRLIVGHVAIRAQDRVGPFAEACAIAFVGGILLLVMTVLRIGGPSDWATFGGSFVVAATIVFFMRSAARQQAILVEVTLSYLLHGGKPLLDQLLGKLIGGTWRREQLKLGDALFDVFETICRGQEWEMKRRVAEALPALGEIDSKRALEVARILRDDWEPTRWRSDLRRRAVEALVIPATKSRLPLLHRVNPNDIAPLLQLREKDEVYTAMAVVEALHEWDDVHRERAATLFMDLLEFSRREYTVDQSEAIARLVDLLQVSKNHNPLRLAEMMGKASKSPNVYVRLAVARNILLLSERLPDRTLDLMLSFADPSQEHNVRRAMARERSVDFLINMLARPNEKAKAEEVFLALISDPDEIIRVTTFDKAETLKGNREFLLKMCDLITQNQNESSAVLKERAKQIKKDMETAAVTL